MARELAQRGALSFDQLLLQAGRLLEEDSLVLAELRRRWRVVMVDEFQDVNPVQGRLIRRLAGLEPGEACPEPPPRLLLVGDRKQSIYAFRGAEVGLFNATLEEFGRQPGQVTAWPRISAPALSGGVLQPPLRQGLRPRGAGRGRPQAVVSFLPPTGRCPPEGDDPPPGGGGGQGGGRRRTPAWRSARPRSWPTTWLSSSASEASRRATWWCCSSGSPRWGLRAGLGPGGLAFHTVRGRGFFASQEVSDLYLALRTVLDPSDEVAWRLFALAPGGPLGRGPPGLGLCRGWKA